MEIKRISKYSQITQVLDRDIYDKKVIQVVVDDGLVFAEYIPDEYLEDYISDELSDETGMLVKGFTYTILNKQ